MIDMLEGILPEESPKEEGYEEERRLFYVGMTRAKEELYIFTFGEKKSSAFSNRVLKPGRWQDVIREAGSGM